MFRVVLIFAVLAIVACDNEPNKRIIGGREALRREIPYMASLRRAHTLPLLVIGGGALISDRWVLTAASAVTGMTPATLIVVLGMLDSQTTTVVPGHQLATINITRHHLFNNPVNHNDIALVQLAAAAACCCGHHGFISPIFVPHSPVNDPVDAVISGWGATTTTIVGSSRFLHTLTTSTITIANCTSHHAWVTPNMICTATFGEGFCSVDIGGPLVGLNGLIGIASIHPQHGCGLGVAEIYTRVSSYRQWISQVAGV